MSLRKIELTDSIWDEEENYILFTCGGGYKWPWDSLEFADWKDIEAAMEAGAAQGAKGAEVVILEDGSDTYLIASMADATPHESVD